MPPRLAVAIPMEAKLGQSSGDFVWLISATESKPTCHNLGQFKETRGFGAEQRNQSVLGQPAVSASALKINRYRWIFHCLFRAQLFGSALESLQILYFRFHGLSLPALGFVFGL
jgi:hypothetical protein